MRSRRTTNESIPKQIALKAGVYAGAISIAVLLNRGCTAVTEMSYDTQDAEQTAEDMGFTQPEVTETSRWLVGLQGCDKYDSIGFEMTAINAQGQEVDILVCKGLLKGATVRQR